jgi:hypothetical protein
LPEPCRSPPGSSCRQLATMSSDSLTMPWPAAAADWASPAGRAARRPSTPAASAIVDHLDRHGPGPWHGTRRVRAPSNGAAPQTFVPNEALAGSRDAAPLPPRPNLRPGQNHLKGKDPVKAGQDATLRQLRTQGRTDCHLLCFRFHPRCTVSQVVTMRIHRIPTLVFLTARYQVLTLHAQGWRARPWRHSSGSGGGAAPLRRRQIRGCRWRGCCLRFRRGNGPG